MARKCRRTLLGGMMPSCAPATRSTGRLPGQASTTRGVKRARVSKTARCLTASSGACTPTHAPTHTAPSAGTLPPRTLRWPRYTWPKAPRPLFHLPPPHTHTHTQPGASPPLCHERQTRRHPRDPAHSPHPSHTLTQAPVLVRHVWRHGLPVCETVEPGAAVVKQAEVVGARALRQVKHCGRRASRPAGTQGASGRGARAPRQAQASVLAHDGSRQQALQATPSVSLHLLLGALQQQCRALPALEPPSLPSRPLAGVKRRTAERAQRVHSRWSMETAGMALKP